MVQKTMNTTCTICQNEYGSDGANIIPVLLTCCGKGVCSNCAESHRVAKVSELTGNKKKIPCMLCGQLFHSSKETPWIVNRPFIDLLGIEVDTSALRTGQGAHSSSGHARIGGTSSSVRDRSDHNSWRTVEQSGSNEAEVDESTTASFRQTRSRTRETNSNTLVTSTGAFRQGSINVDNTANAAEVVAGDLENNSVSSEIANEEDTAGDYNPSISGNTLTNIFSSSPQQTTNQRQSSDQVMTTTYEEDMAGDYNPSVAGNTLTNVCPSSPQQTTSQRHSSDQVMTTMYEEDMAGDYNPSISGNTRTSILSSSPQQTTSQRQSSDQVMTTMATNSSENSQLETERDDHRLWKNTVQTLKQKLNCNKGGFYRTRQLVWAKTESDPFGRKPSFWCLKNGCIFMSPSILWAISQDMSIPINLNESMNYIRSLQLEDMRKICQDPTSPGFQFYTPNSFGSPIYIRTDKTFLDMSPGDIVAMHIKGGSSKRAPKGILVFGVIDDSDELKYLSYEELNPPHDFPWDPINIPSLKQGVICRKVNWLRYGELKKIKGSDKNGNWLAECMPIWLVKVGNKTEKSLSDAIRKMSSEHFLKNTKPIDMAWINAGLV